MAAECSCSATLLGISLAAALAVAAACGDDGRRGSSTSAGTGGEAGATSVGGAGGNGGAGGAGAAGGAGGAGGGGQQACQETAPAPTRGSAIALTPDDSRLITVNRDVGTVTVMSIDYSDGQPSMTVVDEIAVGGEPWQVAIDGCGTTAYVLLRKEQKVVEITGLAGTPAKGREVAVGSEPTGIAITPNNTKLYVANWVDGTLSTIDPVSMMATGTVDLNATLAATGLLGTVSSRPALAHPRALAITNNGDGSDDDESVFVTEWFAQRAAPESADGKNSDTNKKGLIYKVAVNAGGVTTIDLPPITDTGFNDHNNAVTGCFPNQVASVTISGDFAFVTSTCASPVGPLGVFAGKNAGGACTVATQAADCGAVGGKCTNLKCDPNTTDVKSTTHPALHVVDIANSTATSENLDNRFLAKSATTRLPLLPQDVGFVASGAFAYVAAEGTDAVFRLAVDKGTITDVGSANNTFINLRKDATDTLLRLPIGMAVHHSAAFAFVANYGSRDVTALNLSAQAIAGSANDFRITPSSALPSGGSEEEALLKGRRFFVTGLGRWSLGGQGFGSCEACHIDGLSDNVTWYFARGPRQSISLDGSYASKDVADRRIFNWTAIFDEVADFELNTRGVSGGVGAIVKALSTPAATGDRIDLAAGVTPQQGLQGSAQHMATPQADDVHGPHSQLNDWSEIDAYLQTVRSPRKPSNLSQGEVDAGKDIFSNTGKGNCVGCHGGPKWTISTVFWPVGDTANAATASVASTSLSNVNWNVALNGFPASLFPASTAIEQRMRFGAPPGAEQIQCILRPVGTFGVSPATVNVRELRQDMLTAGQGAAANGNGFNPPSLLGMTVGAPYFHGGNARTLEELFDAIFKGHHQSGVAQVFAPSATDVKNLVAYILSIDEDETSFNIPAKGTTGGDLCFYP